MKTWDHKEKHTSGQFRFKHLDLIGAEEIVKETNKQTNKQTNKLVTSDDDRLETV